jgi:hypothetical protein
MGANQSNLPGAGPPGDGKDKKDAKVLPISKQRLLAVQATENID